MQADAILQRLLGLDDYIKETVSGKLNMELMLWKMREPLFDSCENESECTDLFHQAKDCSLLPEPHPFGVILSYLVGL